MNKEQTLSAAAVGTFTIGGAGGGVVRATRHRPLEEV